MLEILKESYQIHKVSKIKNKFDFLLRDYWDFIDFDKKEYRYSIDELCKKYDISRIEILESLVGVLGFIKVNKVMACQKCTRKMLFFNRGELFLYSDGNLVENDKGCERSCVRCIEYNYAEKANILMLLIELHVYNWKYEISMKNRDNLSYIEKLLFIVFLLDKRIDHSDIKEHELTAFVQHETNESRDILNAWIEKGYINVYHYASDVITIARILAGTLANAREYLRSDELRYRTANTINNSTRICVVLPDEYKTYSDYSKALFGELLTANVNASDIAQIDEHVRNKRLLEIKLIFTKICKDNQIPYKDDNALRITFEQMVDRFNLNECNNILNYRSVYVVHSMHRAKINGIQRYRIQHYFRNNLMNHMQYFDRNENAKRYETPLDIDWVIPQVEAFVSLNIIKENIFWADFTAQEITAKWVSAVGVQPG